MQGSVSAV